MKSNEELRKVRLNRAKERLERAKMGVLVSTAYVPLAGVAPEFRFPGGCRLHSAQVIVGEKTDLSIEIQSAGHAIGYKVEGAEGIVDRSFNKMISKGDVIRFSADGQELSVTLVLQNKVREENEAS